LRRAAERLEKAAVLAYTHYHALPRTTWHYHALLPRIATHCQKKKTHYPVLLSAIGAAGVGLNFAI
jgi:hypothetical protein